MFYEFPQNLTIDEVRKVIAEHNTKLSMAAFIEADRGDFVIFNYLVSFAGSFPQPDTADPVENRKRAILRECRGLVMSKATGKPVARRFHKFFNVNEKEFTQTHAIDWTQPHRILKKLDGSMITAIPVDGRICWATKMGLTAVAEPVAEHVATFDTTVNGEYYNKYEFFVAFWSEAGQTVIFEWCSRKQRIVIDYAVDTLAVLAIRDNATGEYLDYDHMRQSAEVMDIPVVEAIPGNAENIHELIAETRALKGEEGYVIRFDNGHMVKIKAEEYCTIHSTKDLLQHEKDVWKLILTDAMDDAMSFMDEPDRDRCSRYLNEFERQVQVTANRLIALTELVRIVYQDSRKNFALNQIPAKRAADPMSQIVHAIRVRALAQLTSTEKSFVLSIWGGGDAVRLVKDYLSVGTTTGPGVVAKRGYLNGLLWDDYRDRDAVLSED